MTIDSGGSNRRKLLSAITACLLFFPMLVMAQLIEFAGLVTNDERLPIKGAIVTLGSSDTVASILAYDTTGSDGAFKLRVEDDLAFPVTLCVRHPSYEPISLIVKKPTDNLEVQLLVPANQLKEVLIKAPRPIEVQGDTIRYKVSALQKQKDYTVEEVIDRIPGMSITQEGKVLYHDKAISHLYINGIDLLEGRYNLATRGIPAGAVEEIEVLKRHNHARIDIGREESNQVALNLKIKDDQGVLFGTARTDAGLPWLTTRMQATPLYIDSKIQNVASVRANNAGASLRGYGVDLTSSNLDLQRLRLPENSIIDAPNTDGFGLDSRYWLDNESLSASNDVLFNGKDRLQVKGYANYNYEDAQLLRESSSVFFFNADSTVVSNRSQDRNIKRRQQGGITLERNDDDLYLKNSLSFAGKNEDGGSAITQNGNDFTTEFREDARSFTNVLEAKSLVAKKVVSSGLVLEHEAVDQHLSVTPAAFGMLLPGLSESGSLNQTATTSRWNVSGFAKYDTALWDINWEIKQVIAFNHDSADLNLKNQQNQLQGLPFSSEFSMYTLRSTSSIHGVVKTNRWRFSIQPRVSLITLSRKQVINNTNTKDRYAFLEPEASVSYGTPSGWNFGVSGQRRVNVSDFSNLYEGLVLTSFSRLNRNPTEINVTKQWQGTLFINYSDILKGFFVRSFTNLNHENQEFTFASTLNADGFLEVVALDRNNSTRSWYHSTKLTKRYFKYLNTELKYAHRQLETVQFFNDELQPYRTTFDEVSLKLGWDTGTWYGIQYKGSFNLGSTRSNEFESSNAVQQHDLNLDFYMTDTTRLSVTGQSVITSNSSSTTVDQNTILTSSFYYKPSKKTFFRISLDNIFNERFFSTSSTTANSVSLARFRLRPRQLTVGFNYSL